MGWRDLIASMFTWPSTMDDPQVADAPAASPAALGQQAASKTGEQIGKMTDPQGYRTYHEYFVGEDRGDGHFPWSGRVYSNGEIAAEKTGLAASYEVARKQAIDWAIVTRKAIGVMWKEQP